MRTTRSLVGRCAYCRACPKFVQNSLGTYESAILVRKTENGGEVSYGTTAEAESVFASWSATKYEFRHAVPLTPGAYLRIDWKLQLRGLSTVGSYSRLIETRSLSYVWNGAVPEGYDFNDPETYPRSPVYELENTVPGTRLGFASETEPLVSCYPVKAPSAYRLGIDPDPSTHFWDYDPDKIDGNAPISSGQGGTIPGGSALGGGLVSPVGGSGPLGGPATGDNEIPASNATGGGPGFNATGGGLGFNATGGGLGFNATGGGLGFNAAGGGLGFNAAGGGLGFNAAGGGLGFNAAGGGLGFNAAGGGLGFNAAGGGLGKQPDPDDRNTPPKTNPLDAEQARREREKNAERNRKWPTPLQPKKYPPTKILVDHAAYWQGLLWQDFTTAALTTVKLAVDFLPLTGAYPRTADEVAIWFSNRGILRQDVKIIRNGLPVGSTFVGALPGANVTLYDTALAGFEMLAETQLTFWNPFDDTHSEGGFRLIQKR